VFASFVLVGNASALERAVTDASVANDQAVDFNIYLPIRDRDGAEAPSSPADSVHSTCGRR
jgi:hypothetical protein